GRFHDVPEQVGPALRGRLSAAAAVGRGWCGAAFRRWIILAIRRLQGRSREAPEERQQQSEADECDQTRLRTTNGKSHDVVPGLKGDCENELSRGLHRFGRQLRSNQNTYGETPRMCMFPSTGKLSEGPTPAPT